MKTPITINTLELVADCASISITKWEEYMNNTTKANGKQIKVLIKKHIPELYKDLSLNFFNPFENQAVKKKGLLIYVHSGIEYFLKYT